MDTQGTGAAKRFVVALLLAFGLGGCVYDPYYVGHTYPGSSYAYSTYDYPAYGYPLYGYRPYGYYVGPPVSLNFGFYEHRHRGGYDGKHHGHGWRGHGGSGHRGGWGHRGGRH